jgi:hypothetical protein
MEHLIWKNALQAKWVIGGFIFASLYVQRTYTVQLLTNEVFGPDGNGGHMLKIVTNLTDEEMARLKYVRRIYWHWRGSRKTFDGKNQIQD